MSEDEKEPPKLFNSQPIGNLFANPPKASSF